VNGSIVRLPAHVHPPFEVFVNGVAQEPGRDYELRGDHLVFARELVPPRPDTARSLLRGMLWGRYKAEHVVDVAYQAGGRPHVVSGLEIRPGPSL
jgi:predicted ATP-grasp superfamily ATP-dependent carboligase